MQEELPYTLHRRRVQKNIYIRINNRGEITVSAPLRTSKKDIDVFVLEKIEWIIQAKNRVKKLEFPQPASIQEKKIELIRAKKVITSRVKELAEKLDFKYNRISIKDMKSRWGSCSADRNLNFNFRLNYLPTELMDYVIIHEFCHLKEMNHGENFWKLVELYCPDYILKRRALKKYTLC